MSEGEPKPGDPGPGPGDDAPAVGEEVAAIADAAADIIDAPGTDLSDSEGTTDSFEVRLGVMFQIEQGLPRT